ncbi:MAG: glycosyltransferase family 39 protein [bacterium]|nr:glycosyltransferase family 39 protein [bacterium]
MQISRSQERRVAFGPFDTGTPDSSGLPLGVAGRIFAALVDRRRQNRAVLGVLAVYVLVWTLYAMVAKSSQDIHPDTGELLTWSHELALGYWKHPPLGVYVVKLWTMIFPVADWSFYLLGTTNAALALWFTWRASESLISEEKRLVGLALLTLVPFFNFLALDYNHNTLLLPLWAMTALFFLRSFKTGQLGYAALAGLAAGLAMLGKYWSIVLIVGLVMAALTDARRREYFFSASPWISVLVGGAVLAPHCTWLLQNHFVSVAYASSSHAGQSAVAAAVSALTFFLAAVLYASIPLAIVAFALRPSKAAILDSLFPSTVDLRFIALMFWAPLLLPLPIAIAANARLVSTWAIPTMTFLPIVLLGSPLLTLKTETSIKIVALAVVFPFLALLAAPLVALNVFLHPNATGSSYYRLLSTEVQRIWRKETDRPIRWVIGDRGAAVGAAFYSGDRPVVNPRDTASDDPMRRSSPFNPDNDVVRRQGVVAVCMGNNSECAWLGRILPSAGRLQEVTLARRFLGWSGKPAIFSVIALPPVPASGS